MSYESWVLVFLGMLTALLLFNVGQWMWYRERAYGLYTVYVLVWLSYFLLRNPNYVVDLPDNVVDFVRIIGPMLAYFTYFDFAIHFLSLRTWQPRLVRLFRYVQVGLAVYLVVEIVYCFGTDLWQRPIHELTHTVVRTTLAILSGYIIALTYGQRDLSVRFFITGSLMLVLGALVAMLMTIFLPASYLSDSIQFWQAPLTYLHIGIIGELLFFSLGLAYRNRQEAIRKALVDTELSYEREQRRREKAETELAVQQLRQEMTDMQMRALQVQISPHFLFNSLNSLSSLISDEPERAEVFVDQMSSVYRYLLQANDRELTTLAAEMQFIQSYFHLLKTRYNQGIDLDVTIPDDHLNYLLPPLTLQLLVENAVKHNVVSATMPLRIQIYTDPDSRLFVRNNLQRKRHNRIPSTRKGLLNITEKYRLLNLPELHIAETDDLFEVVLPLVRPAAVNYVGEFPE